MHRSKYFLFLLAAFGSATAVAQSSGGAPNTTVAALEQQTENGVKYVCGGIGRDEVASLERAASDYDLMMTFAASNGAYLADVDVAIADARGRTVLNVTCDGPILLVDLPARGNYRVEAEAEGRTLTRTARVDQRGPAQRIRLAWPVQTVDMGLTPGMQVEQDTGRTSSGASGGASGSSGLNNSADESSPGKK
ncbi:hypothetical protein GCM10027343_36330 [Noviherbaspirillum agri]